MKILRYGIGMAVIAAAVIVVGVYAQAISQGDNVRISHDFNAEYDVMTYSISPDGNWVYYRVRDLFSAEGGGSYIRTLADNGKSDAEPTLLFSQDSDRTFMSFSPDSSYIFYTGSEQGEVSQLFSKPVEGGEETLIVADFNLTIAQEVEYVRITPNGQHVIYLVSELFEFDEEQYWLYSLPVTGGKAVLLAGPIVDETARGNFLVTPDGTHVVYKTGYNSDESRLLAVPVAGGPAVVISGESMELVEEFKISPDGNYVVFRRGGGLTTASIDGTQLTKIATPIPLIKSATQNVIDYKISPNSQNVVYYVLGAYAAENEGDFVTAFEQGLYSVPILGGTSNLFKPFTNTPNQADDGATLCSSIEGDYAISADSRHVVLSVNDGLPCRLYSVFLDSTDSTQLPGGVEHYVSRSYGSWFLTNDSQHVVYVAQEACLGGPGEPCTASGVFAVPIESGEAVDVIAPLMLSGYVKPSENGNTIAFEATERENGPIELYSFQLSDSTKTQISGPSTGENKDFGVDFQFRPGVDDGYLLYIAEQRQAGVRELFLGSPQQLKVPTPTSTPTQTNTPVPPTATATTASLPPTNMPAPTNTLAPLASPTVAPSATPPAMPGTTPTAPSLYLPLIERP